MVNSRCGLKEAVALGEPLQKQPRAGGAAHGDPCWNTAFLEDINIETILENCSLQEVPLDQLGYDSGRYSAVKQGKRVAMK